MNRLQRRFRRNTLLGIILCGSVGIVFLYQGAYLPSLLLLVGVIECVYWYRHGLPDRTQDKLDGITK